jgi:hypothetical protein
MNSHTALSSRAEQTARDPTIVLSITQSTVCAVSSLCEVLRFAQDNRIENEGRI